MYARELLNRIKWDYKSLNETVLVSYLHRGAPNDTVYVRGNEIVALKRSFFYTKDETAIPYHRILTITYKGKEIFRRRGQ